MANIGTNTNIGTNADIGIGATLLENNINKIFYLSVLRPLLVPGTAIRDMGTQIRKMTWRFHRRNHQENEDIGV